VYVGIDLTGPFTNNEYLLVVIDYYSRFPEVEIVRSSTSATIINKLRKIFAVHKITKLFHVTVVLFSTHLDGSHEQVEEYVGGVCAELPVFVLSV
jgi:hypothetical protein